MLNAKEPLFDNPTSQDFSPKIRYIRHTMTCSTHAILPKMTFLSPAMFPVESPAAHLGVAWVACSQCCSGRTWPTAPWPSRTAAASAASAAAVAGCQTDLRTWKIRAKGDAPNSSREDCPAGSLFLERKKKYGKEQKIYFVFKSTLF